MERQVDFDGYILEDVFGCFVEVTEVLDPCELFCALWREAGPIWKGFDVDVPGWHLPEMVVIMDYLREKDMKIGCFCGKRLDVDIGSRFIDCSLFDRACGESGRGKRIIEEMCLMVKMLDDLLIV